MWPTLLQPFLLSSVVSILLEGAACCSVFLHAHRKVFSIENFSR